MVKRTHSIRGGSEPVLFHKKKVYFDFVCKFHLFCSQKFEESQGRTNSKTAFYQALQNSLGGEDSNLFIENAATWYYSLEHSTDDYSTFSRALENATR